MRSDNYYDDGENVSSISKFVPTIVLISAMTGFVYIALYAYNSGRDSIREDDLLIIEAEKTPMKEEPKNPGGMIFPNQDKTIFETFSTKKSTGKAVRVLPAPEEPIDKSKAIEVAIKAKISKEEKTSKTIDHSNKYISSESQKSEPQKVVLKKMSPVAANVHNKESEIPKKYKAKTSKVKTDKKTSKKEPAKLSGAKIQLGAYGSKEEATRNWKKMQKKIYALSKRQPVIVRANVRGKTFYRLRVGGFANKNSAKSLCKVISAKGQACMAISK